MEFLHSLRAFPVPEQTRLGFALLSWRGREGSQRLLERGFRLWSCGSLRGFWKLNMLPNEKLLDGLSQVFTQMPAVGNLLG